MARTDKQILIRIPSELREQLHSIAKDNKRSVNAEVVAAIETTVNADKDESKFIEKIRDIAPYGVRLPTELKKHLQENAKKNGRSLNSEIVARLTESCVNEADSLKLFDPSLFDPSQPGSLTATLQEVIAELKSEMEERIKELESRLADKKP